MKVEPPPEGVAELVRTSYPSLVRTASIITGDDHGAHDVVQEAFSRLVERWAKISTYEQPVAWLRLVVVRLAVRQRDRHRRELRGALPDRPSESAPSTGLPEGLALALGELSPRQRALVTLHYLDDLSVEEAARVVGVRVGTAKTHLHRARAHLAVLLSEEGSDVHG